MNAAKRLEIFRRLHEDNPEPKTELAYSSPFELLIAVILSAQSTDVGVNKATAKLFPVANTPLRSTHWASKGCPNTSRPSVSITAKRKT
jgi:endonuclease III